MDCEKACPYPWPYQPCSPRARASSSSEEHETYSPGSARGASRDSLHELWLSGGQDTLPLDLSGPGCPFHLSGSWPSVPATPGQIPGTAATSCNQDEEGREGQEGEEDLTGCEYTNS